MADPAYLLAKLLGLTEPGPHIKASSCWQFPDAGAGPTMKSFLALLLLTVLGAALGKAVGCPVEAWWPRGLEAVGVG